MKRRKRISAAGSNSLIRYLAIGGLNTCLAYAYFYALYSIIPLSGIQRISASLYGSMAISVFVSYALQKRFVWKDVTIKNLTGSAERHIKFPSSIVRGDGYIRLAVFGVVAASLVYVSAQTTTILDSHLQVDPRISQLILTPPFALTSFWANRKIFTGKWR